jgi:cysteinyl-tRNA synthetase
MTFVRAANAGLDGGGAAEPGALAAFDRITDVLQVVPASQAVTAPSRPPASEGREVELALQAGSEEWARDVAGRRAAAKRERNWVRADELRRLLLEKGFEVRDTKDGGFELRKVAARST